MNGNLDRNIEELKKQFMLSFHNDGIVDIFVGWSITCVGLEMLSHAAIFSFIGWLPLFLVAPIKSRITLPRWGYAKFSEKRRIPLPILLGTATVLVIGALALTFIIGESTAIKSPIAIAVIGLGIVVLLATGWNRIAVYAVFIPLFFIGGLWLRILSPPLVIFIGTALILMGIGLLVIFLRNHPITEDS